MKEHTLGVMLAIGAAILLTAIWFLTFYLSGMNAR